MRAFDISIFQEDQLLQTVSETVQCSMDGFDSPWLESPFRKDIVNLLKVGPEVKEAMEHFADQGYLIIDLCHANERKPLFDAIVSDLDEELSQVDRIEDGWRRCSSVKKLVLDRQILRMLSVLYARKPVPFQSINFKYGTQQPAHSDLMFFSSFPERYMCGVWVPLEDVSPANGALCYYPGSHKLPFSGYSAMGLAECGTQYSQFLERYPKYIEKVIESHGLKKQVVTLKKGQIVVWAANLLHGGQPYEGRATRFSQVNHYFFENCKYYSPLMSRGMENEMYFLDFTNIETGMRTKIPKTKPTQVVRNQWRDIQRFGKRVIEDNLTHEQQKVCKAIAKKIGGGV